MTSKVLFPEPIRPVAPDNKGLRSPDKNSAVFGDILAQKLKSSQVKFSQHAQQRLRTRNIELSEADIEKLNLAAAKAREKGARESLVLLDRLALVVSIKNNTVITAVDEENLKENVFTNIDSAVIM
ncbi:MAG: flagellar protein [Syntrophomonadaceae bacterium]|nr:flagellar protein [Syntrophomonadaceae bacterium]